MSNFGATIAIIHEGRVLLIKREDFEVWGLPRSEFYRHYFKEPESQAQMQEIG